VRSRGPARCCKARASCTASVRCCCTPLESIIARRVRWEWRADGGEGPGPRGGGEGPFYRGYLTLTLTLTLTRTPSSWESEFALSLRLQRFKVVLRVPTQAERAAHAELLLRRLPRHALAIRCGTKQAVPAAAATTGAATEKRA